MLLVELFCSVNQGSFLTPLLESFSLPMKTRQVARTGDSLRWPARSSCLQLHHLFRKRRTTKRRRPVLARNRPRHPRNLQSKLIQLANRPQRWPYRSRRLLPHFRRLAIPLRTRKLHLEKLQRSRNRSRRNQGQCQRRSH